MQIRVDITPAEYRKIKSEAAAKGVPVAFYVAEALAARPGKPHEPTFLSGSKEPK
jgi:hypothetical protein